MERQLSEIFYKAALGPLVGPSGQSVLKHFFKNINPWNSSGIVAYFSQKMVLISGSTI
jgi:hypothetical protein